MTEQRGSGGSIFELVTQLLCGRCLYGRGCVWVLIRYIHVWDTLKSKQRLCRTARAC